MSVELKSAKRLTALKNKIDAKTETPSNTLSDAVDNVISGYGQGCSDGIDMTAYIVQTTQGTFSKAIEEITEDFTVRFERATSLYNAFRDIIINAPKLTIYISNKCVTLERLMRGSGSTVKVLEIIGDTVNVASFYEAFSGKTSVERIICEFNFTSATKITNMFNGCSGLIDASVKPNTLSLSISFASCRNLSDASIDSIVNGLADMTGGTVKTLTVHSTVFDKIVSNPVWHNAIINKNWTYE